MPALLPTVIAMQVGAAARAEKSTLLAADLLIAPPERHAQPGKGGALPACAFGGCDACPAAPL